MTCWRSTSVISLCVTMGLVPDAILSHHRDTDGHSNWCHITTKLYTLSACDGGKSRIAEVLITLPACPSSTIVNTSCVNFLFFHKSVLLIIIQALARRLQCSMLGLLVTIVRVVLAVARSRFRQRQYYLTQFTDMLFCYCYKCFLTYSLTTT